MRERQIRRAARVALLALAACGGGSATEPPSSPLARDTPLEQVVAALLGAVPGRMQARGVPGVSIALVRDGQVAWTQGFGVANALTREPVTTETVFEIASNTKPVTAYAALGLVRSGRLSLDAPLADAVKEPVLPESPQRDGVTLRRVLSHTSGMSNLGVGLWVDREIYFPPGERFSYSGQAFGYLQQALESVTGRPFAAYIEASVLGPLGMSESGFAVGPLRARHASGHLAAWVILLLYAVLVLLSALLLWPFVWLAGRPRRAHTVALASAAAGLVAVFLLIGPGLAALVPLGLILAVLALALLARFLVRRRGAAAHLAAAGALVLAGVLATRPAVPIPVVDHAHLAAGGLRATANDLARFLAAAMQSPEMRTPQVWISERLAWGLGIGIQRSPSGDFLWQWGQNPGFESLMLGDPGARIGVVVLTNGGPPLAGLGLAREIAQLALGGEQGGYWAEVPGTFLPAGAAAR